MTISPQLIDMMEKAIEDGDKAVRDYRRSHESPGLTVLYHRSEERVLAEAIIGYLGRQGVTLTQGKRGR